MPTRNNVTFKHPAKFIPLSGSEHILAISGADWFVSLLQRVDGLSVQSELCQEDWGVVIFVERGGRCFWIGLGLCPEEEPAWLAHFHHTSFAWLQRWNAAGKLEFERLVSDFNSVLTKEPAVREIAWYHESEMRGAPGTGSPTPDGD